MLGKSGARSMWRRPTVASRQAREWYPDREGSVVAGQHDFRLAFDRGAVTALREAAREALESDVQWSRWLDGMADRWEREVPGE
jgi:hypothetical protein